VTRLPTRPYNEPCLRALVLKKWPDVIESTLELDCWHFALDGLRLRRRQTLLYARKPDHFVFDIRDLEVFPLKYATKEEMQALEERGLKYWLIRDATFLSYTGLDVSGESRHTEQRMMVDYETFRRIDPKADPFRFDGGRSSPYDAYGPPPSSALRWLR
jgi:hypothetical protein